MTFNQWLKTNDAKWYTGATLCDMFGVSNSSYTRMKLRIMVTQGILEMRECPTSIGLGVRFEYRIARA